MQRHSRSSMPTDSDEAPQEAQVRPYQALGELIDLERHHVRPLRFTPLEEKKLRQTDSVAVVSGGLDSTTMVYHMLDKGYVPHLLCFNYGQRHAKETVFARMTAKTLDLPFDLIDLTNITHLIDNSALTSPRSTPGNPEHMYDSRGHEIGKHKDIEVPEGHYAEETMKATVVPNRNMIMLSIAAGVAVNEKARTVGFGVHAGDHFVYPDCRPEFVFAAGQAILTGNEGFHNFWSGSVEDHREKVGDELTDAVIALGHSRTALPIYAPFLDWSKADIAYRALELGVPLHLTWSCYKGGDYHCGRCGTCVERLEAIDEAIMRKVMNDNPGRTNYVAPPPGTYDMTEYADTEFWKTAVKHGKGSSS